MHELEDKIKQNLNAFNAEEPADGHLERFNEKLDHFHASEENWYERNNLFLKIAASTVIFITVATLILTDSFSWIKPLLSEQIVAAELPAEVKEVMQYYNVITDEKVEQIDELAVSDGEAQRVKDLAIKELQSLEEARKDLEQEYAKQPGNQRIMNALLKNQQRKAELLDKIINTMNQVN